MRSVSKHDLENISPRERNARGHKTYGVLIVSCATAAATKARITKNLIFGKARHWTVVNDGQD